MQNFIKLPKGSNGFKQINKFLLPLKSSEDHRFPDGFRGNRSQLIHLILEAEFDDVS